ALERGAVARCRARLARTADLARYTTADAVADLEAVRAALGHDRIDLSGLSYGTRVAQEYLRAHPDRVRAVALLGSLAPDQNLPLPFARTAQVVLDELARQCAADAACHAAVPDLGRDVRAVDDALRKGHGALQAGPFWEGVRALLVTTTSQRRLPWLLHEAAQGRFTPILDAMKDRPKGADGLLLSVECPEDTLHITQKEQQASTGSVFGAYRLAQQIEACIAWRVPAVETGRAFVRAQTPVLLLAGTMDHVTPLHWAEQIAARLPNARVVTFPLLGHFPEGLSHIECYDRILADFFESGTAAGLDLGCIGEMRPPPFATR
ncbi:MAG: alpha/beta fold hydrolase, partial [Myxococcales bacterium]